MVLVVLTALILLGTLVYGPLAAALVETFPTRIRYTSSSVPFHLGVRWLAAYYQPLRTAWSSPPATSTSVSGIGY
jgi:hypothetical protein